MWPFCNKDNTALRQQLAVARAELEDLGESYMAAVGARGDAELAMQKMQKALTNEGVADIARAVTAEIADIYAGGGHGVRTRDIRVHATVAAAIREAVKGEKHWNEARLAAEAQEAP